MTRARRRVRLIALATLGVLAVGLGLGQALRDDVPPSVWSEAPERVAVGESFALFISADEPASFRVHYGDTVVDTVDQEFTLEFEARPGTVELLIVAEDAAGNRSESRRAVDGVLVPVGSLDLPDSVVAGSPYAAVVHFDPPEAPVDAVELTVDGVQRTLHGTGPERWALIAAPLAVEPSAAEVSVRWQDAFARASSRSTSLIIEPLDQEVQELRIPASTLAVITPEGRALEAEVLASAVPDPSDAPRWSEPFILPVEGRATSGFARARRYAAGGRVSFHEGEDIAAPTGTPIRATNDGIVVVAGTYPIKGGLTVIDHGAGVTSRYYHQASIDIEVGAAVQRGQIVGTVGSTGLSTGPHLHWEMRVDDVATDPLAWVGKVRP